MELLIAYDGSKCAEAAIDDLARAGLPANGTAQVISVAEVFLPPQSSTGGNSQEAASPHVEEMVRRYRERSEETVAEAAMLARYAESRVRAALPKWSVSSVATSGSPAWEIIDASEKQASELIVVGSQGHSALGRFFSRQHLAESFDRSVLFGTRRPRPYRSRKGVGTDRCRV